MSLKTDLHNFQNNMFDLIMFITYLLIFISAIGFSESAPKYLNNLDYYIRVYICLFLIWRFNPLRKTYEFTDLDRKIDSRCDKLFDGYNKEILRVNQELNKRDETIEHLRELIRQALSLKK